MSRTALIGSTGFVGGALSRARRFDRAYNSSTIEQIAGEQFDLVICAGAPATMWAANARPEVDAANLDRLFEALTSARIGKLTLVSTVAVFDDGSAGYTETNARFETRKAYGRNRRALEERAAAAFDCNIVRLPSLFGPDLKKNFIFDLLNPVPSFVAPAKHEELMSAFEGDDRILLGQAFAYDAGLAMWKFRREAFGRNTRAGLQLESAFAGVGFLARSFTNSASAYQFYNVTRLADDIDTCLASGLDVLNICSEPLRASDVHQAILGMPFQNSKPAQVNEDVHTDFAGKFGATGAYLYRRELVLQELKAFATESGAA